MSADGGPGPVVLAERGVGGYCQYRIPALTATTDAVLCAFDARLNLDDLPAPIDLLLRRSSDSGRSWSDPQIVRTGTGFEGFGDPSLLTDPTSGRVLLFHSATIFAGFFESSDSLDDADPHAQHADLGISDDGGHSWRHVRLSSTLRASGNAHLTGGERISGLFATSGAGCALTGGPHAGRLVQPFVLRVGARIEVACALSDDHGETWRLGAPVPTPEGAELNESSVAALPGGALVLHSRGTGCRWQAMSHDGGETFAPAVAAADLVDSGTNGSVLAVGGELFASHTADPNLRRRATISRSSDGGHSWREARVVAAGAAGYTQLAELPDGGIGIIYEANGYQQILFERFSRSELRAQPLEAVGRGPGWKRESAGPLAIDVVLRSITPPEPAEETGPTHEIDLTGYTEIPTTVFKEIGLDRSQTVQVLRTREGLAAWFSAGIHAGETLTFHARVHNTSAEPLEVDWAGQTRVLGPRECWVRRDLRRTLDAPLSGEVDPVELADVSAVARAGDSAAQSRR